MLPVQDHFSPICSQYLAIAFQPNDPCHSVVLLSPSGIRNEKKPFNLCFTMVLLHICWTVFYPPLIMGLFFCSSLHSNHQKMGLIHSPICPSCGVEPHTIVHVFTCSYHATPLTERNLWERPRLMSEFLFGLLLFNISPLLILPLNPLLLTGKWVRCNAHHYHEDETCTRISTRMWLLQPARATMKHQFTMW